MSSIANNVNKSGVVFVVTIVAVILGLLSLNFLPLKLLPDTSNTVLRVETKWRSASPYEVESSILENQERVLRDIPGLIEMTSKAYQGRGRIDLSVSSNVDKNETLIQVLSRLNNVKEFPEDALPPEVKSFSSAESLVFLFIRQVQNDEGNENAPQIPIDDYQYVIDHQVKSRMESIPGVGGVQTFIGAEEQLQITINPEKAAGLSVSLSDIPGILSSYQDITGGSVDVGRKNFLIRLTGADDIESLKEVILHWRNGRPVRLKDIAEVKIARGKRESFAIYNGEPAIGLRLTRGANADVLSTLAQVTEEIENLNNGLLAQHNLKIEKSFNPAVFIKRALGMVFSNVVIGILIAISILYLFFRSWRTTLVVSISVPTSLIVTLIFLAIFDRTLNVIALAGIALATGLVMDAAIVVLESIVQQKERGKATIEACIQGTKKVAPALFTSTLTTIAIFLPIALTSDNEAQLFTDLAITITASVCMSLLVALYLIPAICKFVLPSMAQSENQFSNQKGMGGKPQKLVLTLESWVKATTSTAKKRVGWLTVLVAGPVIMAVLMLPNLDYLPPLRKDSIDTFMRFPPGAHLDFIEKEIAIPMAERLEPYLKGEKDLKLKNYYIAVSPGIMSMATRVEDQGRIDELKALIKDEITANFPDTRAFSSQGSITGRFGGNRAFTIHLRSDSLDELYASVGKVIPLIKEHLPGAVVRPSPSLSSRQPELRFTVRNERLGEAGWTYKDLRNTLQILGDGLYIGEHFTGKTRIDKLIKSPEMASPTEINATPVMASNGATMELGSLVDIVETTSPTQLLRVNQQRAVSLAIIPPKNMTLGEAINKVQELIPSIDKLMPEHSDILMGSSSNKLNQAIFNLITLFISAVLLLFLIMAAMFGSVKDSFIITMTLPLASAGGVLALFILNLFIDQSLDLLTLIGFIILMGLVVNNAILLVSANNELLASGHTVTESVYGAVRIRLRPILISTLTSIFGMLPLLLNPGTGSEIYRGLAAVVVGGMTLSMFFTLIFIPCILLTLFKRAIPVQELVKEEASHA